MLELAGYLACGLMIGAASLIGRRLTLSQVGLNLSLGLIGMLLVSLVPHLGAPEDAVRAALSANAIGAIAFFFALLAGMLHLGVQILAPEAPDTLRPRLIRWSEGTMMLGAALLVVGLATAKLTLATT
ncbi:MAG: hypothetical protein HXY37_18095 [Chloroflexi bacterium]|nr:hypothetical protein [Chloroflexota bacterium]